LLSSDVLLSTAFSSDTVSAFYLCETIKKL